MQNKKENLPLLIVSIFSFKERIFSSNVVIDAVEPTVTNVKLSVKVQVLIMFLHDLL